MRFENQFLRYDFPQTRPLLISSQLSPLNNRTNLINFAGTPARAASDRKNPANSPSTPHRIELRSDSDEGGALLLVEVKENDVVDGEVVPMKTKKRVNGVTNQQVNKQTHKLLTEFYPVRRSVRKTKKTVLEEQKRTLEQTLRNELEEGLEVKHFEGKGRGVVASRAFKRGDFVVEYSGDLIDPVEAKRREERYALDKSAGCYMYYFKHNDQQYCIDATAETGRLGRLVNHSRNGNLITRTVTVDNRPRLVLIAKNFIEAGEEITYDYGDRSKESLRYHPWLAF